MKNIFVNCVLLICVLLSGCCRQEPSLDDAGQKYLAGDYEGAAEIFLPKAHEGDPEAQVNIAFMYYCGLHLPQNKEKAAKWYKKSAQQNNMNAQFGLGTLYENAHGVEQDFAKAWFWYSLAEKQGDTDAKKLRVEIEPKIPAEQLQKYQEKLLSWKN